MHSLHEVLIACYHIAQRCAKFVKMSDDSNYFFLCLRFSEAQTFGPTLREKVNGKRSTACPDPAGKPNLKKQLRDPVVQSYPSTVDSRLKR